MFLLAVSCAWIVPVELVDDADGDGFSVPDDCDDSDPAIHPEAEEVCDGIDNDCDALLDDNDPDVILMVWYADGDGDGYGTEANSVETCGQPDGFVELAGDCDDADQSVHPEAAESCEDGGADSDCDGEPDAGASGAQSVYEDLDGDGFGADSTAIDDCDPEKGAIKTGGDCDDADAASHPEGSEICDGADNDCDGEVDEEADDCTDYFYDGDGDGYGVAGESRCLCEAADGYTASRGGDCDDTDSSRSPGLLTCRWSGGLALGDAPASFVGADGDHAGYSAHGGGDLNLDGDLDLVIGAPQHDEMTGAVYVLSGPLSASPDLSKASVMLTGEHGSDRYGSAVEVRDVNGDGISDLMVAAEWYHDGDTATYGSVFLHYGPLTSESALEADVHFIPPDPDRTSGFANGYSSVGQGDWNGDGNVDLVVGAWVDSAVYVFFGPSTGRRSPSESDAVFYGADSLDAYGYSVASAGDVDADGFEDLLIGDPKTSDSHGTAYVITGPLTAGGTLGETVGMSATDYSAWAGWDVDGAGDVNGDGYDDILIGAYQADEDADHTNPEYQGETYLMYGPVIGGDLTADADATLTGVHKYGYTGHKVAGPGDVDGDGLTDVLVSGVINDTAGDVAAWLAYGPLTGTLSLAEEPTDFAGASFTGSGACSNTGLFAASAGDINRDGLADLLIGEPCYEGAKDKEPPGRAFLFPGGG